MTMKQRIIAVSSVAAVGLAGAGLAAGVALADSGSTAAASPSPSASPSATAGKHAGKGKGNNNNNNKEKLGRLIEAKRLLHGEFVTSAKAGYVTMDTQRGSVTAASATSISLRSVDGFTATYVVPAQAKVRKDGAAATPADVKVGAEATVVAVKTGSTLTVKAIVIGAKTKPAK